MFGPLPTLADELPADTNKIKTLTPTQAQQLAEESSATTTLCLNGLTTLDADTAKALADFSGTIRLNPTARFELAAKWPLDPNNVRAHAKLFEGVLSGVTTLDMPD